MSKRYLDLHVLQTLPPSNVNRDDTGSPKSATFGGTRRARVSSQAWKRAIRLDFRERLQPEQLGIRSKRLVGRIAESIAAEAPELESESRQLAQKLLESLGLKAEKTSRAGKVAESADTAPELQYLVFLSNQQIQNLAEYAVATAQAGEAPTKKAVQAIAKTDHSVDIALFGRMVADLSDLRVDAAAQVAHALSVHPVETEFDYFTAVDDIENEAHAGAGMIGNVEFNSSTLYRYATLDVSALREALGDAAVTFEAIDAFVQSFVRSMPTGKQNTFAHRTLPHAVVATLRSDQPINLVGAFEDPARASGSTTLLLSAATKLADHARQLDTTYPPAEEPTRWVAVAHPDAEPLASLGSVGSVSDLVAGVREAISTEVSAT